MKNAIEYKAHITIEELNEEINPYEAILEYGNKVIAVRASYSGGFAAVIYESKTGRLDFTDEVELIEVSDRSFEDNGHAVAWALNRI